MSQSDLHNFDIIKFKIQAPAESWTCRICQEGVSEVYECAVRMEMLPMVMVPQLASHSCLVLLMVKLVILAWWNCHISDSESKPMNYCMFTRMQRRKQLKGIQSYHRYSWMYILRALKKSSHTILGPFAIDILLALSSSATVERTFSTDGDTIGRRNWLTRCPTKRNQEYYIDSR